MNDLKPTPETAALADVMTDPLNRFYRYKAARALLPLAMKTPVTPNQITFAHTAIGITAGVFVAQGNHEGLIIAFFLSEARMILDCLDGVVARAKKMSSPYGRTLDELGDAISWLAICAGMFIHIRMKSPEVPVGAILFALMAMGALMAWGYDFYKRKFGSALKSGTDCVYDEILSKEQKLLQGQKGFVTKFGLWFDWMQIRILVSGTRREMEARIEHGKQGSPAPMTYEVQYILKNAHSKNLRLALRALSLMCGDNAISIVNIGMLTGDLVATQMLVIVYSFFTVGAGVLLSNIFLHGSRREQLESALPPAE